MEIAEVTTVEPAPAERAGGDPKRGIVAEGLRKAYGRTQARDGLYLRVAPGEIFGLIGPNGAGKTTTLRILAGLLMPDAGRVTIEGIDALRRPRKVRRLIGYMPEDFGLYDELRVWEYLDFYADCFGIPGRERRSLIGDLLALVDLTEKREGYVDALSRGMKQRLCLARTLVHDPQLLILDEPASGLDPRARVELRALLRQLGALGKTVIVSSHILTELADICDHVGIIERGRLLASGAVVDLLRQVQTSRVVLVRLIADARMSDGGIADRVRTIAGVLGVEIEPLASAPRGTPAAVEMESTRARALSQIIPGEGALPPHMQPVPDSTAFDPQAATTEQRLAAAAASPPARLVRIEFDGDDYRLYQLLGELLTRGLPVYGFTEEVGDLEDAFMRITRGMVA